MKRKVKLRKTNQNIKKDRRGEEKEELWQNRGRKRSKVMEIKLMEKNKGGGGKQRMQQKRGKYRKLNDGTEKKEMRE